MLEFADLKAEYRAISDGDARGDCMGWWFRIADEIEFKREALEVPDAWRFRPSPMGSVYDAEEGDYVCEALREASDDAVMRFGELMHRLARALRHAGKDY